MRQKYYIDPFAFSGDQTAVPDAADPSGFVSYTLGYTFDYERLLDGSDPLAKFPTRQNMNYLLFEETNNIQQYQQNGVPEFITSTNNGGTPFTYSKGAQVLYSGSGNPPFVAYISLVDGNADTPPSVKWLAYVPVLAAPRRILLQAATNFYVSQTGSDASNGLTVGTPWATFAHAMNVLNTLYDFGGQTVTLNVAGAFTTQISAIGSFVGMVAPLIIDGGGTANIIAASGSAIQALNGAALQVQNITISQAGTGPIDAGLYAGPGGSMTGGAGITFGVCGGTGILANGAGANLQMTDNFTISGNMGENFASAASNASLGVGIVACNISTAITCVAFVNSVGGGIINWPSSATFTGSGVTGFRFGCTANGVIATNGSSPTAFFPGSANQSPASGGQYT